MYVIIESALIDCPWCKKAKKISNDYNQNYCVISLSSNEQKETLICLLDKYFNINQDNMHKKTGSMCFTFPQIFYVVNDDLCLNNLDDLTDILENKKSIVEYIGGATAYISKLESEFNNN